MKARLVAIAFGFAAVWMSSCTKVVAPGEPPFLKQHLGEACTVQFRRDALGGAATLPVPPTSAAINGATVAQEGTLQAVEGEGIVIEDSLHQEKTYWIPYDVILNVSFTAKK